MTPDHGSCLDSPDKEILDLGGCTHLDKSGRLSLYPIPYGAGALVPEEFQQIPVKRPVKTKGKNPGTTLGPEKLSGMGQKATGFSGAAQRHGHFDSDAADCLHAGPERGSQGSGFSHGGRIQELGSVFKEIGQTADLVDLKAA
jgi:hypothetical protein